MTFKLPALPSAKANIQELADYAELVAWEQGSVSQREIVAYLGRVDDNDSDIGCNDDEDENTELLDDVMLELDRRLIECRGGYPFDLLSEGTLLKFLSKKSGSLQSTVYRYLLLSTRLDMSANNVHRGIDGCHLLELLAVHVLKVYLGKRAKACVFGTSAKGNFEARVSRLCADLREGVRFRNPDNIPPRAKDDKLDAVAWIPFRDGLPGQLIVFGQCKTGTNWGDDVSQLQPIDFINKWIEFPFLVPPVRAFCVSESADRQTWRGTSLSTGILFDRCRMVDLCKGFNFSETKKWTEAAKKSVKLVRVAARKKSRSRRRKIQRA